MTLEQVTLKKENMNSRPQLELVRGLQTYGFTALFIDSPRC